MAREFGPTRLESLWQASNARAAMVEAARASLADDVSVLPEVSHSRRRSRAVPAFAVAGVLGIAAIACGGAKGTSNHEFTPTPNNPEPTATRMSEALPTTQVPTQTAQIEPTATLILEPTATEEIPFDPAAAAKEITRRIAEIQAEIITPPGIPDILAYTREAEYAIVNDDPAVQGVMNNVGHVALAVENSVCQGHNQDEVVGAWFMLRDLMQHYGERKEASGQLPVGAANGFVTQYFGNPDCAELQGR
ncbi:hypothetical protein A2696_01155 [Candidatus Curtissbacteria bacterium RIFCSPHIGHO2_01_FULL_41_13]|uniref:Uncharacterized protein n=1 Tax=Candidatus Curtissbacteria bacterium RIFCSPHIGHO2_01_FULL_41_13 TaxID=1797745 RepID=A0A1F5FZR2_9BACT|nr:MAG: hypothetical protein A2696_01155 [Candidatus Curtissbacteria bacterium RIFCSPHIGHO2_01_FULL_41_13]